MVQIFVLHSLAKTLKERKISAAIARSCGKNEQFNFLYILPLIWRINIDIPLALPYSVEESVCLNKLSTKNVGGKNIFMADCGSGFPHETGL